MSYAANSKSDNGSQANTKVEGAGVVTSDSLAGESLSQGGDFGKGSNAAASAQPSSSTTTNNTDISGATTLNAAPDAAARLASEGGSESSQLNAGQGQGKSEGTGPTYNQAAGGSSGKPYNTSTGSGSNAGTAPSYVSSGNDGSSNKPHGANIKEGGFDSDAPNASFNNDVGGKNDPSRVALQEFQQSAASTSGAHSGTPAGNEKGSSDAGQFGALGGDTSA